MPEEKIKFGPWFILCSILELSGNAKSAITMLKRTRTRSYKVSLTKNGNILWRFSYVNYYGHAHVGVFRQTKSMSGRSSDSISIANVPRYKSRYKQ